jgi:hypothetical protein
MRRWGRYTLDSVTAVGGADVAEGVALEELSLRVGPATAVLKGQLLGARQDASLAVTDFPLDLLQVCGGFGGGLGGAWTVWVREGLGTRRLG